MHQKIGKGAQTPFLESCATSNKKLVTGSPLNYKAGCGVSGGGGGRSGPVDGDPGFPSFVAKTFLYIFYKLIDNGIIVS